METASSYYDEVTTTVRYQMTEVVENAEAIAAVRPYAVDSASGTEAAPGRKDPQKLRAFIAAVGACADPTQQERPAQAKRPTVGQPA